MMNVKRQKSKMRNSKTSKQQHCLDMCWRLTDILNRNWRIANGHDSNDFSKWKFTFEFLPVYAMYVFGAYEAKITYGKPFIGYNDQIDLNYIASSGYIGGEMIEPLDPNDSFEYLLKNYCDHNGISFQELENLLYL